VPTGAAGFVAAVEELAAQLANPPAGSKTCGRVSQVDRIVFPSGSGGTHAGLLVGVKALGMQTRVEGIYDDNASGFLEQVRALTQATAMHLRLDLTFSEDDFILHAAYGRPGYGVITDAEREAIRLLASSEGIICDPVYTGRALAGLIDLVRQGVYGVDETVLFWHTGGTAGLFPRASELFI
jgi:D-cysteine desulfhydrase